MKIQTFYAIVKIGALKYRKELRCPLMEAQAPIFWNRSIATKYRQERGLSNTCEIKEIYLENNDPHSNKKQP